VFYQLYYFLYGRPVIPNLGYAYPRGYEPGYLGVREKYLIMAGKGYLLTVTTYKIEITANILITNILLIRRLQFMEIGCAKGYASDKRLGTTALDDGRSRFK
jgi:hypothetical protein